MKVYAHELPRIIPCNEIWRGTNFVEALWPGIEVAICYFDIKTHGLLCEENPYEKWQLKTTTVWAMCKSRWGLSTAMAVALWNTESESVLQILRNGHSPRHFLIVLRQITSRRQLGMTRDRQRQQEKNEDKRSKERLTNTSDWRWNLWIWCI